MLDLRIIILMWILMFMHDVTQSQALIMLLIVTLILMLILALIVIDEYLESGESMNFGVMYHKDSGHDAEGWSIAVIPAVTICYRHNFCRIEFMWLCWGFSLYAINRAEDDEYRKE